MNATLKIVLATSVPIAFGILGGAVMGGAFNRDYTEEARHGADRYCVDLYRAPCDAVSCLGMDCTIRLYEGIEPRRFICDLKGCAAK
jgi:hypothetical protein